MAASTPLPSEVAAETYGPTVVVVISSVLVLSTLFMLARMYTKIRIMKQLHMDDYLIILSMILGWTSVVFSIIAVHYGNGRHLAAIPYEDLGPAILFTLISFVPGALSFGVPKLAATALLTRILSPSKTQRIILWSLSWLSCLSVVAASIVIFLQCWPVKSRWDFSIPDSEKHCWNPLIVTNVSIAAGAFSAFVDMYLAVYPATVLYGLHINRKKKIALSVTLGVGSVSAVVAVCRTTRLPSLASSDFTYDTADLIIWTAIEGHTIIVASCIPVLKPLLENILGRDELRGGSNNGHAGDYKPVISDQSHSLKQNIEMAASVTRTSQKQQQQRRESRQNSPDDMKTLAEILSEGNLNTGSRPEFKRRASRIIHADNEKAGAQMKGMAVVS